LFLTDVENPTVSSPGDMMKDLLFLIVLIVACWDGTGDTLLSISLAVAGSVFSAGKAIRDPPRTPPSHDRKQALIAPQIRMIPAKKVGRRYGNF
jgi:hypothetical protein